MFRTEWLLSKRERRTPMETLRDRMEADLKIGGYSPSTRKDLPAPLRPRLTARLYAFLALFFFFLAPSSFATTSLSPIPRTSARASSCACRGRDLPFSQL